MTVELARAGGAVGALGLAVLMLAPGRAWRLGGLGAWVAGCAVLVAFLAPGASTTIYAAGAVGGALATVALAALFLRVPWLLPVAVLACAPARIPVSLGEEDANLLVPLYLVVAAAALALAWQLFWDGGRARELGPLAWPLGLFVAWSGLGLAWSADAREGAIYLLFFVLPFGLLAVSLARLRWRPGFAALLAGQLALMAIVFAAIGGWQYLTRNVFWNPKVIVDNAYAPSSWFYRVNSVFYDPSIYGRFLVLAILVGLVLVLFARRLAALAAVVAVAVIWAGLVPSFSQSSFVALGAGALAALVARWRPRALVPLALVAAVAAGIALGVPQVRDRLVGDTNLARATSGRSTLVSNGIGLALDHPAVGVGTGGFKRAYAERVGLRGREPKAAASHTTPITVAAELGIPGLALLAWLVAAALVLTLHRVPTPSGRSLALLASGLCLLALSVHSLFYDSLFEDPLFWALLALAAVATREPA